jgi:hypothetical protein
MRAVLATSIACLVLASPAGAATAPTLSVSPNPVSFGQTLTARGKHWPVIEFCKRTVHVRLRSAQNAFEIGTAHVKASGRWLFDHKIRHSEVGAGHWTLVARLNCESGNDGSPNPVIRRRALTIQ